MEVTPNAEICMFHFLFLTQTSIYPYFSHAARNQTWQSGCLKVDSSGDSLYFLGIFISDFFFRGKEYDVRICQRKVACVETDSVDSKPRCSGSAWV